MSFATTSCVTGMYVPGCEPHGLGFQLLPFAKATVGWSQPMTPLILSVRFQTCSQSPKWRIRTGMGGRLATGMGGGFPIIIAGGIHWNTQLRLDIMISRKQASYASTSGAN